MDGIDGAEWIACGGVDGVEIPGTRQPWRGLDAGYQWETPPAGTYGYVLIGREGEKPFRLRLAVDKLIDGWCNLAIGSVDLGPVEWIEPGNLERA